MTTWSREQVLAVVRRSPERVAEHDRAGWLGLFDDGAVVEVVDAIASSEQSGFVDRRKGVS